MFLWPVRNYKHQSLSTKKLRTDPCTEITSICSLWAELQPVLGTVLVCMLHYTENLYGGKKIVYRAGPPIHRGFTEGLTHGEGDVGGANAGGRLDGERLFLLGDFHGRTGGCRHGYLPQEHVNAWWSTNRTNVRLAAAGRWFVTSGMNVITAGSASGFDVIVVGNPSQWIFLYLQISDSFTHIRCTVWLFNNNWGMFGI